MSARAIIDSLEFALNGRELRGDIAVESLDRLADELSERSGRVNFLLQGGADQRGRPQLHLQLDGTVVLQCQRCLGRLEFPVELDTQLLLLDEKASAAEVEVEDLDAVPVNPELDVWSLVEDEVILALPIAPRHPEGVCEATGRLKDDAASPFAVLSGLKDKQLN